MLTIREENDSDIQRIERIEYAAFKDHPMHPPGTEPVEHRIVTRLREVGELSLSLLAEEDGRAVGHIALSPAVVGEFFRGWFILGPVGVLPEQQNQGVGSKLIREALDWLRQGGAAGVVLVGDPGFYVRFGFASHPGLTYPDVPDQYVLGLSFTDAPPKGDIVPPAAFAMGHE